MEKGVSRSGLVSEDEYKYYKLSVACVEAAQTLILRLTSTNGDANIYVSTTLQQPTDAQYQYKAEMDGNDQLDILSPTAGVYYIGVHGATSASFKLQALMKMYTGKHMCQGFRLIDDTIESINEDGAFLLENAMTVTGNTELQSNIAVEGDATLGNTMSDYVFMRGQVRLGTVDANEFLINREDTTLSAGGDVRLRAANSQSSAVGGSLHLQAGSSESGSGGTVSILSGQGHENSSGDVAVATDYSQNGSTGRILLETGNADSGPSGHIFVTTGRSYEGPGGSISLTVGAGDSGAGGGVLVTAGESSSVGESGGSVVVSAGAGSGSSGSGGGAVSVLGGTGATSTGGSLVLLSGVGTSTSSGAASLATADAGTAGVSGAITVRSGSATVGASGSVAVTTGDSSEGASGDISLASGAGTEGAGGSISLTVGAGDSGAGGSVVVSAGDAADAIGGSVVINAGDSSAATSGSISIGHDVASDIRLGGTSGATVAVESRSGSAGAISLVTNGGASEQITLRNAQGTGTAALDLVAVSGGVTMDASTSVAVSAGSSVSIVGAGSGSGAVSLEASTGGLSLRGNTNLDMYGDTTVHGNLYVTDEMTYSETYSTFVHVTTNQDVIVQNELRAESVTGLDIAEADSETSNVDLAIDAGSGGSTPKVTIGASVAESVQIGGSSGNAAVSVVAGATSSSAGQDVTISGGAGAAASSGTVHISGGAGSGAVGGGAVSVAGGASSSGAGGGLVLDAGASTSGTGGSISVGTSSASAIAVGGASGAPVTIASTSGAAGAILVESDGGISETITLRNKQGTGADAIKLHASAGGVDVGSSGLLSVSSSSAGVSVAASTSLDMSSSGTGANAIMLSSSAGGISFSSNDPVKFSAGGGISLQGGILDARIYLSAHQSSSYSSALRFIKTRGSSSGKEKVNAGDRLGLIQFQGCHGNCGSSNEYQVAAKIEAYVPSGAETTSSVPGELRFYTLQQGNSGASLRARLDSAGALVLSSFATQSAGDHKLYVDGSAYTTSSWASSDQRLKTNITQIGGARDVDGSYGADDMPGESGAAAHVLPMAGIGSAEQHLRAEDSVLERVLRLRGIEFEWSDEAVRHSAQFSQENTHGKQIGLLAQEVEVEFPNLVREANGYKAVAYDRFVAILLEALREEVAARRTLESAVNQLEEQVAASQAATDASAQQIKAMVYSMCEFARSGEDGGGAWAAMSAAPVCEQ